VLWLCRLRFDVTYSYTGDLLAKVCPPTSTTGAHLRLHRQHVVPDDRAQCRSRSYWRFGDPSGTTAVSSFIDNAGVDNATYANVTLGSRGRCRHDRHGGHVGRFQRHELVGRSAKRADCRVYPERVDVVQDERNGPGAAGRGNQPLNSATARARPGRRCMSARTVRLHAAGTPGAISQIVSTNRSTMVCGSCGAVGAGTSIDVPGGNAVPATVAGQIDHLDMSYVAVGAAMSAAGGRPNRRGWRSFNGSIAEVSDLRPWA